MLCTKGYGFTVEDIKNSCPSEIQPYIRAHTLSVEESDMFMWRSVGAYGVSALVVAIDHCINGQKAKTEYPKTPVVDGSIKRQIEENNLQRQREEFVSWMETMQANFEANKAAEKLLEENRGG